MVGIQSYSVTPRMSQGVWAWGPLLVLMSLGGVGLLGLANPVQGQSVENTTLRYRFTPGETLHYVLTQKMKVNMKLGERMANSEVNQVMDMSWKVNSVSPEGKASITQTIDRVQATLDTPSGKVVIDTKDAAKLKDANIEQLASLYKSMVNVSFTQDMDPQGVITNIQVPEAVATQFRQAAPGLSGPGGILSAEGLKTLASQSSLPLPPGPVTLKTQWNKPADVTMPGLGITKVNIEYSYAGKQADIDLIKVTGNMTLSVEPSLADKLKVELKVKKFAGYAQFDSRTGQMKRFELNQDFTLTTTEGNQVLLQNMEQSNIFELRSVTPAKTSP